MLDATISADTAKTVITTLAEAVNVATPLQLLTVVTGGYYHIRLYSQAGSFTSGTTIQVNWIAV